MGGGAICGAAIAQTSNVKDWPTVPDGPFHWQLQGDVAPGDRIKLVGSDLFETSARQVHAWRDAGLFPICDVTVGAVEDWLDVTRFERFSDVIIQARFDLCRDKGFLAIEPDNIDAFEADDTRKDTGFDVTPTDQLRYIDWLIDQAHQRGLAIGQKNAPDLVPELVDRMDFALLESAYRFGFMDDFDPYVAQGKPVFAVEYRQEGADPVVFCPDLRKHGFQGIFARVELDRAPQNCP